MQSKYSLNVGFSLERRLLLECKKEFKPLYACFHTDNDFTNKCTKKALGLKHDIPEALVDDFITCCEDMRVSLNESLASKRKSVAKIENLLARMKFLRLRFLI